MNIEKKFQSYSKIFLIIIIVLVVFLIVPDGTRLPPLEIIVEASEEGVGATINKPTGSEIVALILILIVFTIWIYMYLNYKKEIYEKKSKKK